MPSGSVMLRLSARALSTVSFLSRGGCIYPSTMLQHGSPPRPSTGRKSLVVGARALRRSRGTAAAGLVLWSRRSGGGVFGRGQPAVVVGVRALELADGLG